MAYLALEDHAAAVALLAPALEELELLDNVPGKEELQRVMTENLAKARAAPGKI